MKHIKKLTALLITFLMIMSCIPVYAASSADLIIQAGSASGKQNETITVDVSLANNPGITGAEFKIAYNSAALTLESVTNKNIFTLTENTTIPGVAVLKFENTDAQQDNDYNGPIATLTFKIAENASEGEKGLVLQANTNLVAWNHSLDGVPYRFENGDVDVELADENKAAYIQILSEPAKTIYKTGEALDLTGGKIKVTYKDRTTENIDMTPNMVSGFDSSTVGTKKITVTYKGKSNAFSVEVVDKKATSVEVSKMPTKAEYQEGDSLDVTGGKIKVKYEDNSSKEFDMTNDMVSGYDKNKIGEQTLTVKYQDVTTTFKVKVVKKKKVTAIAIAKAPTKVKYQKGEELDVSGGKIKVTYEDKTAEDIDMTADMVTDYDSKKVGKQTLTVTYEGLTATYDVEVADKPVSSIAIATVPAKIKYQKGDKLDVTGGKIKVTYTDKTTEDIDMTADMVSGFDSTRGGKQTLTVTYGEKTTTFEVEIEEKKAVSMEIIKTPLKVEYVKGEDLNVTGGKIKVTYEDKTTEEIDMTLDMVHEYDKTFVGTQKLVVKFQDLTAFLTVTVKDAEKPWAFIDVVVDPNNWIYQAAKFVYDRDIMTGMDKEGKYFNPAGVLSRGQFATIIYRVAGEPPTTYAPVFPDVNYSDWFAAPSVWANKNGVITGYASGLFGPGDDITREQMALIMYRYAQKCGYDTGNKSSLSGFIDAYRVSSWAEEAMQWAVGNKIITGTTSTTLEPQGQASRAQAATIIMRFMELYDLA